MSEIVDARIAEIHDKSIIRRVPLAELRVDDSYQRDFSETMVDEIANNWNPLSAELITVSDRGNRNGGNVEGGLWIVNGQHRSKAAAKKTLNDIDARVIDLTQEEDPASLEAALRLQLNRSLKDRPLERFKAQLRAGDPESTAIVKIVESFSSEVNIGTPSSESGINCIVTVERIFRIDNSGGLLRETFQVVHDAYGRVGGKSASSDLLKSVCWFIEKHAAESDRDRLVSKLTAIGLTALHNRSLTMKMSQYGALWVNYYKVLVEMYNEQLAEKYKLDWKLRGKKALSDQSKHGYKL